MDRWLPGAIVEADHSWGLVETFVLQLNYAGSRFIVKAARESDRHIEREIHAHLNWLDPWTSIGRAPALRHFDAEAKILVTRYLPGRIVQGTAHADDPRTYLQAGRLLALMHAQTTIDDPDYEARVNGVSLSSLNGPHRIAADVEEQLRVEVASWPTPTATLVATHGDWQPRNWLVHEDVIRIIDFGRAGMRPALSDFARLAVQDFCRSPELWAAFLKGYGSDPRDAFVWHRIRVREAIGTATWAYRVGDEAFEAQGHEMIAAVLSEDHRAPVR